VSSSGLPDYFSLFGLTPRFELDPVRLQQAYDQVLNMVHPDRHVGADAGQRRAAMQLASLANEALRVLRQDVLRASYLCQLHGIDPEHSAGNRLPTGFLEQQMAWREALDEARDAVDPLALSSLRTQVQAERQQVLTRLQPLLDDTHDYAAAASLTRALMFLDKLANECDRDLHPGQVD
jgi:molecular chaperone HscB